MNERIEPAKLSFEQQKWKEEESILRDQLSLKKRELELRELEIAEGKKKGELSRWTNPLVVSILTVAFTGLLNVASVLMVNRGQNQLESDKHNYQLRVESDKSTREMLSQIVQAGDHAELCRRMKFVDDIKFTETPAFVSSIQLFLSQQCQSSTVQPTPQPHISLQWSSDWLGGGHNQAEQCKIGQALTASQNPGRTVVVTSSSEDSRKDILGRVTYKYYCSFDVL